MIVKSSRFLRAAKKGILSLRENIILDFANKFPMRMVIVDE